MARFTSFDDWSAWMQTVIKENGVGAITGPVMQEVLAELSDTAEYLVNISGSSADGRALAAEGYAVGTQRGVPVEEGSPYYHNNAKYWAEVVASRAAELGELTAEARQAIDDANAAVRAAAGAAHDATEAAGLAEQKAGLANDAAELATQKAGLADDAAELANQKAQYADQMGDYAKGEIDGAKGDYESLDARFDHVDEISMYWQTVSTPSSDPDLVQEYDRVLAKAYQMMTDMGAATRSARSATTTAEQAGRYADQMGDKADASSRVADEKSAYAAANGDYAKQQGDYAKEQGDYAKGRGDYADGKGDYAKSEGDYAKDEGDYAQQQGFYAQQQGDYAKAKANEIENAKGDFQTLAARLNYMQGLLEKAMYFQEIEN